MDSAKDRLLAAALELFSSRGYAAVSTRSIAEAAAVNEVTLFRLFGAKARLFEAVHERYFIRAGDALSSVVTSGDPRRDLVELARAFARVFEGNHKIVAMSIKDIRDDFATIDQALKGQHLELAAAVAAYLRASPRFPVSGDAATGDATAAAALLFAEAVAGFAVHRVMQGRLEGLEDAVARLSAMLAGGLEASLAG